MAPTTAEPAVLQEGKTTMNGAEILVDALAAHEVRHVFGLPGDEVHLFEALRRSGLDLVVARHEQGAAFMADVYARVSGRPGVVFSTLGPGATNLVTGIANAHLDRSPVIAISDQVATHQLREGVHQYLDLEVLFGTVTKWSTTITDGQTIRCAIAHAFEIAAAERKGPVHLTLPADVLAAPVNDTESLIDWPFASNGRPHPRRSHGLTPADLREVAGVLGAAEAPIAIVGNLPTRARVNDELIALLETLQIPVFTTYMGKGAIPEDHPLSLGVLSRHAGQTLSTVFEPADLILTVGFDLVEGVMPTLWRVGRPKRTIVLDAWLEPDAARGEEEIQVIGDPRGVLDDLLRARNGAVPRPCWLDAAGIRVQQQRHLRRPLGEGNGAMRPQDAVDAIRQVVDASAIVVSDVGLNKYAVGLCFAALEPGTVIFSNGLSALGFALPGAIGAKLARPEAQVIAVAGDGGFLMNVQELETMARRSLPVVTIVFRDDSYGLIQRLQENKFGASHGVALGNPDLPALARSFGVEGVRATTPDELVAALTAALAAERATVIDVPVCYDHWLR
jgi:acetolactate synthase I/II/III large subunit